MVLFSSLIGVATSSASPAVGANNCLTVGYTVDYATNVSTLAGNDSIMIGSQMIIVSGCGQFKVYIDGFLYSGGSNEHSVNIVEGVHSIKIEGDNFSASWNNMTFFPGSEVWIGDYPNDEEMVTISSRSMWWDEIVAHGVTALIIYILSTTAIYQLAKWRVDRAIYPVV